MDDNADAGAADDTPDSDDDTEGYDDGDGAQLI
jgi:hypothetical protein